MPTPGGAMKIVAAIVRGNHGVNARADASLVH